MNLIKFLDLFRVSKKGIRGKVISKVDNKLYIIDDEGGKNICVDMSSGGEIQPGSSIQIKLARGRFSNKLYAKTCKGLS